MFKKIAFFLFLLFLLLLAIFFVPVSRSFSYEVLVQAPPAVAYQKMLLHTTWRHWYFSNLTEAPTKFSVRSEHVDKAVHYQAQHAGKNDVGTVSIIGSPDGGSLLQWQETLKFSTGISSKLKALFRPAFYAAQMEASIARIKIELEKPTEVENGVRFKMYKLKGHAIAALSDTVSFSRAEAKMKTLYKQIRSRFAITQFWDTTRLTSRYTVIRDSLIDLQVGLRLKDATTPIPAPLKRLEVPSILLVVASAKATFKDIEALITTTDDWCQRYNLKLATLPWVEHTLKSQGSYLLSDTLRIVQPFYYWPHPITESY